MPFRWFVIMQIAIFAVTTFVGYAIGCARIRRRKETLASKGNDEGESVMHPG